MDKKSMLLKRLQICDFVLTETCLFLDTHPTDKEALKHFEKYQQKRKETLEEYTKEFGTICLNQMQQAEEWDWCKGPWPWELEG